MRTAVDGAGRRAGLAVFMLGVLLLVAVFSLAYLELVASGAVASPTSSQPPNQSALLLVATKGLFLFLMGFVASAISNKGIGLYQAAVHAEE